MPTNISLLPRAREGKPQDLEGARSFVAQIQELQVAKSAVHLKAEAEHNALLLRRPTLVTPLWDQERAHSAKQLNVHLRAYNVERLNRCTGVFLKPRGLGFHFVKSDASRAQRMCLCDVVGRRFHPLANAPSIPGDKLHDDGLVSFAIWWALQIAYALDEH